MNVKLLLSTLSIGALALVASVPSAADVTTFSVEVTAGSLSLTVPADAGSLGSFQRCCSPETISGSLGEVKVVDVRSEATATAWVVSVISTALTPSPPGPTIAALDIGYTAGVMTKTGTVTLTANDPESIEGTFAAVTASGIVGDNTATWDPTISVLVKAEVLAGVYSGTITHSLL